VARLADRLICGSIRAELELAIRRRLRKISALMKMKITALHALACGSLIAAEPSALSALLAVGPEGAGHPAATAAWQKIVDTTKADALPDLLKAVNGANPLAANWLRGAISAVAQRSGETLPIAAIAAIAKDTANAPASREIAFALLKKSDAALWDQLMPTLLNDPAEALRGEPVRRLIATGVEKKNAALLRQALNAARNDTQVKDAAEHLRTMGEVVDLPLHFGFIMDWQVIGPFDNGALKGFDTAYPPESTIDPTASYPGKELKAGTANPVKWQGYTSEDQFGMLNFNKPIGMIKEAVAYATHTFHSPIDGPAEIRLGGKNAWKVWLDGKLLFSRDEYHRGAAIDQYRMPISLKKGPNPILVKCCQNGQTETWTVEWEFQLRVCDATGTPILATDRKPTPPAALHKETKSAK
jgi:hypothetical protein